MFKHIVIANDGSEGGLRALTLACDLAKLHHATLHMISVEEIPDVPASIDEVIEIKSEQNHKFHDALSKARAVAKEKGIKLDAEVVAGHAVRRATPSPSSPACRAAPCRGRGPDWVS
jgi:nucleotide-binding universal stress UspA family protein